MTEFNRKWAMPNSKTFTIKPIKELILKHIDDGMTVVEPFANECSIKKEISNINYISNDLDTQYDPPYSPRQVSEVYKSLDMTVNMQTTQSSYWSKQKEEISRIVKNGGKVITFGWNSGGIGKTKGFEIIDILLVAHSGWHNDTICTVDYKK